MRHFGDLSIRHKLTALFMAISGFTALAVSGPIAIYDMVTFKQAAVQSLAALGRSGRQQHGCTDVWRC